MPGRFFLLVVALSVAAGGCAAVSENRLSLLESAVLDLQAREARLASLEETVAGLVARNTREKAHPSRPGEEEPQARPGPRRVDAAPAAPPASLKKPDPARAERQYRTALSALESGRPQTALTLFREFLADYPDHALAPNAGYWLGECSYTMKRYDAAIIAFKDVVAQHPRHEKAAAAMLKAGYGYALLGDNASARFYLEALTRDFPSSQPASLARTRLASL